MKDSNQADELIGRVFASLRDAEAGAGLEERVLRGVEKRSAESTDRGWTGWQPGLGWTSGLVVAAASVVLVALVMGRPNPPASQHGTRTHHRGGAPESNVGQMAAPTRNAVMAGPQHEQEAPMHHAALVCATHGPQVRDVAAEEARAPSMLAPPMPLTASEVLLQQSARRGHPKVDSPLNPEVRAKERLQAAVEFTDFFTPPPAKTGNE